MSTSRQRDRIKGFTLIEIIVTMVVLAIASTAILSVFSSTVSSSANPAIQQQAISIAEAYMEEISLKSFDDPNGTNAGESTRADFDNVLDYNSLPDTTVRDQNNNAIPALNAYNVAVAIANPADPLNGIPAVDVLRIDITVGHAAISAINLTGYRTRY